MVSYSYPFDFQRTPKFFDRWNVDFKVEEFNTSNNFEFVISDFNPTNIDECVDANGKLNEDNVHIVQTLPCSLIWDTDGGTANLIRLREAVTWNIGDNNYYIKGLFLRHRNSGFVMGYSINISTAFNVNNTFTFDKDILIWSFVDGV